MGAENCCCGCAEICINVPKPLSVTLTLPLGYEALEGTYELNPATVTDSVCEIYETNLLCGAETTWNILRDVYCKSAWPSSNQNDTTFAVGQYPVGCQFCYTYVTSFKRAYEESQYSSRTMYSNRKTATPHLKIEPIGTTGNLLITLKTTYGDAISISQVEGVRNRVKIATLTCEDPLPTARVTALSEWFYATDPILPVPLRCFPLGLTFCDMQQIDNNTFNSGSCSESETTIGFEQYGCSNFPINLRNTIGTPWCNPNAFYDGVVFCYWRDHVGGIAVQHQGYTGAGYDESRFEISWAANIHCSNLYDGPITLNGGIPGNIVDIPYGTTISGIPIYGDEDISPCTNAITPLRRRWVIPPTISIILNQ